MLDIPIYRAAIGGLGPWELVIILLIVLVVFGAVDRVSTGCTANEVRLLVDNGMRRTNGLSSHP